MELVERDFEILKWIHKFRFCLGRHIRVLAGFSGVRATNRRLKLLLEAGYLERKKYMYGVPYLYTLTHKGRILSGSNKRQDKIRIDRIMHDISVLDTVVYYASLYELGMADIESEKELHIKDGFGSRKHYPDFVFTRDNQKIAVEIELTPKTKDRMEQNVRDNYMTFDTQIWITANHKVLSLLRIFSDAYANIDVVRLEEVQADVQKRYS